MKRHHALAHLSRDHHAALILARLLQINAPAYKGLPSDLAGKAAYAVKFYKEELVTHFKIEEEALSLAMDIDENLDALIQVILHEHRELDKLFESISINAVQPLQLDSLGRFLESHIRKEERQLFPLMQEACSEELLETINNSLSYHYIK